jgi:hypothetical protein
MSALSRRRFIAGAAGAAGLLAVGGLAGCSLSTTPIAPGSEAVRRAEPPVASTASGS